MSTEDKQRITGHCLCGAISFEITEPFTTAGYCHCTHCQRRTGTGSSANARASRDAVNVIRGREQLRVFQPTVGVSKWFCGICGSHLFSGDLLADDEVSVRLGSLDSDPGIRPQYHAFVDSAAPWEPVPDDGLERFSGSPFRRQSS